MPAYSFVTGWRLEAPIEAVWDAIYHSESWSSWWDYVEKVVEVEPGNENGVNAVRKYTWKTRLPYKLTFNSRTTRVEAPFVLEAIVNGDLEGRGRWHLSRDGKFTTVHYEWNVRTSKRWMNWVAPLARPIFKWNHDAVMRQGGEGLARLLGTTVTSIDRDSA